MTAKKKVSPKPTRNSRSVRSSRVAIPTGRATTGGARVVIGGDKSRRGATTGGARVVIDGDENINRYITATLAGKLSPLTGITQDYSGVAAIDRLSEQVRYSNNVLKARQLGPPDFSTIFSGR